ncbi:hypothetical protein BJX65DRAFT_54594 [Aspergillus insuetus]
MQLSRYNDRHAYTWLLTSCSLTILIFLATLYINGSRQYVAGLRLFTCSLSSSYSSRLLWPEP